MAVHEHDTTQVRRVLTERSSDERERALCIFVTDARRSGKSAVFVARGVVHRCEHENTSVADFLERSDTKCRRNDRVSVEWKVRSVLLP